MSLFAVASGGALGAVARYLASGWVQDWTGGFFPWGTFVVNVSGCLLLGFALVWLQGTVTSTEARELVMIGFLGSFTTFSTFSYEAIAMVRATRGRVRGRHGGPCHRRLRTQRTLHTDKVLRLSSDLPVIVEVVDDQSKLDEMLTLLDPLMGGGLITMERAHVIRYRPGDEAGP